MVKVSDNQNLLDREKEQPEIKLEARGGVMMVLGNGEENKIISTM